MFIVALNLFQDLKITDKDAETSSARRSFMERVTNHC